MIQKHTMLKIIDNSGASTVQCIHVSSKGKNNKTASTGSLIKVSVKRLKKSIPKKKVKKGEVLNVLVTSTASQTRRLIGQTLKEQNNHGVVLNKDLDGILSSRVVFPLPAELRRGTFSKILILAPRII